MLGYVHVGQEVFVSPKADGTLGHTLCLESNPVSKTGGEYDPKCSNAYTIT